MTRTDRIATAGSCFAQRLGRALRERGLALFDVEPPPAALPPEQHAAFGYGLYTARYGNLYTTRQLLQLAEQAFGERDPRPIVWTRGARFFDAQRPTVEPEGLDSPAEVAAHRAWHLDRVRALFAQMEVFVFTLGMTEAWADRATGTVFPTAPGVVAGRYDPAESALLQLGFQDVCDELEAFRALLARHRTGPRCRILLTVSPVPVAATATDDHVLVAAVGSKATLRAAATELRARHADIDYLPSFDLVASPCNGGLYYNANRRTITPEGVARAVALFFDAHGLAAEGAAGLPTAPVERLDDAPEVCEDAMLDAFAPDR
ncbi:MAG: GSCFA domain-containing protein [Myxococcales bacterium]|nr:GSCFA domain-containing protein [Myxococcales bacterium]